MKENMTTALTILGTVLFFGIVNPQILISDDTVSVQDESGNVIEKFSELPGSTLLKIEQLLEKIESDDDVVEYRFHILDLFHKEDRDVES